MNKPIIGSFGTVVYFENRLMPSSGPKQIGWHIARLAACRVSAYESEIIFGKGKFFIVMAQFSPPDELIGVCFVKFDTSVWRVNFSGKNGQEIPYSTAVEQVASCDYADDLFCFSSDFKTKKNYKKK